MSFPWHRAAPQLIAERLILMCLGKPCIINRRQAGVDRMAGWSQASQGWMFVPADWTWAWQSFLPYISVSSAVCPTSCQLFVTCLVEVRKDITYRVWYAYVGQGSWVMSVCLYCSRHGCVSLILGSGLGLMRSVLKAEVGVHRPAEPSDSYPWMWMVTMMWVLTFGGSPCLPDTRARSGTGH